MELMRKKDGLVTFILFTLLIPFFSIHGIRSATGEVLYQGWQIISTVLLIVLMLTVSAEIKLNWAVGLFMIYQAVILGSTFVHHGFSPGILAVTTAMIMLFMLLQSRYYREILDAISMIVVLSAVANLITMVMNYSGAGGQYFIGGKNALGIFLVPGAFVLLLNSAQTMRKTSKKTFLAIGMCLISVFLGSSGTGIVVAVCSIVLMAVATKFKPKKQQYLLIILIFYGLLILFTENFVLTRMWLFLTDLLEKDSTLTSRTAIWTAVKEMIGENWLFGGGRGTRIYYINTLGITRTSYEAHNFILEILLEGGVAALTLYATLFVKAVKRLNMNIIKNRIVFIAMCVLLINGLTESTVNNCFVTIILGIACRYAVENQGGVKLNGK